MSQCFKCKQGIGTLVSRDGPKTLYCTDCFLGYCSSTVRDNAFQQCCLPCDTPVAVGVSGGPNSMVLLHELGQLRQKMRDQYSRQQRQQQQQQGQRGRGPQSDAPRGESDAPGLPHHDGASLVSSFSSSTTAAVATKSIGTTVHLLPFHLCEAELIIPPALSPSLPSSSTPSEREEKSGEGAASVPSGARQAAVLRVRESMQQQFDTLHKLVQQQPPLWTYSDESAKGHNAKQKKKKKEKDKARKGPVPLSAGEEEGAAAAESSDGAGGQKPARVALFEKGEVRVFHYSDFLPAAYIQELQHALHASRLSLSDREALYDRVRQQVLCRATQRLIDEWTAQHPSSAAHPPIDDSVTPDPSAAHTPSDARGNRPGWYHLLVGSNAACCATAAFEALVTGAGGEGVVHASAFRGRLHDVWHLRPLRTVLPRESVLWGRLLGITGSYTPALRTGTSLRSVHGAIENFVHTMILSYRTMVFNVLNTVQRLQVHPSAMQQLVNFATLMQPSGDERRDGLPRVVKKALPGRTAQQNFRDLSAARPPVVFRTPSSLAKARAKGRDGGCGDCGVEEQGTVQCCVCGCPAALATAQDGTVDGDRQVEVFAMTTTEREGTEEECVDESGVALSEAEHDLSTPPLDCFVCYACRSLMQGWTAAAAVTSPGTESNADSAMQHILARFQ